MADRVSTAFLRYRADSSQAEKSTTRLSQMIRRELGGSVSQVQREMDELRGSIGRVAAEAEKVGRGNLGGLQRLGALAGNVPGLGGVSQALGLADDIADAAESLPELKTAIAGLGATTLATVGATAALVAIYAVLAENTRKVEEAARSAIAANLDYVRLVETGTTQSLTEQRAAVQEQLDIARGQQAEARRILVETMQGIVEEYGGTGLLVSQINAQLGTGAGELRAAKEAAEQTTAAISPLENQLRVLDTALGSDEVAANDAAAAIEAHARVLGNIQLNRLQQGVQSRLQAEQLIQSASSESAKARLAQAQLELRLLQDQEAEYNALFQAGQLLPEQLAQFQLRIRDLQHETEDLTYRVIPLIDAREQESEAVERQAEALEAKTKLEDALADLRKKTNRDIEAIETEAGERIVDIKKKNVETLVELEQRYAAEQVENERQYREEQTGLLADLADADAETLREAEQERQKLLRDIEVEERQALEDHNDALKRIQRDANRDIEGAIADRDATTAYAAEQRAKDAIDDENAGFRRELDRRREAFDTQLADLASTLRFESEERRRDYQRRSAELSAQHAREAAQRDAKHRADLAQQQKAANDQIAQAQDAKNKAITLERERLKDEQRTRIAAYKQQIADLNASVKSDVNIRRQGLSQVVKDVTTGAGQIAQIWAQLMSSLAAKTSGASGGSTSAAAKFIPAFAEGPPVRVTTAGIGRFDPGDVIIPPRNGGVSQGINYTFAPSLPGLTRTQIRREFETSLNDWMDEMGID